MGFIDPFRNRHQTGGLQHLLAKQIRQEVGEDRFSSFFKFAVVRNPFDRLVSQFAYMQEKPRLRTFAGLAKGSSFSEYLASIKRRRHVQWEPQCSFLYDDDGTLLVDFVARFESLEHDMGKVFSRLGLEPIALPHCNDSNRAPYRSYYSDEDRAGVELMYRDDLDRLGYAF
jgi:hypothetical protein